MNQSIRARVTQIICDCLDRDEMVDNILTVTCGKYVAFEVGRDAGRREVVKWIEGCSCRTGLGHYCPNCDNSLVGCNEYEWQAQLRKWGIEKEDKNGLV